MVGYKKIGPGCTRGRNSVNTQDLILYNRDILIVSVTVNTQQPFIEYYYILIVNNTITYTIL